VNEMLLAALDAQIARVMADARAYLSAMDGRSEATMATQAVAWQLPAVRESLKARAEGGFAGFAGPWVMFLCPNGHRILPARLSHPGGPDDDGSLLELRAGKRKGRRRKAEMDSPTPDLLTPLGVLNGRDQWTCPLLSCPWPGRAYRPEHLLRMHVLALVAGIDSVPVEPVAPSRVAIRRRR